MSKLIIIYFWRDGAYCTEENFQQEHYKHAQGYLYLEITDDLKDYEIQEYIYEYLKNIDKKIYLPKGTRGGICGIENCRFYHNTFYQNKTTGIYYCKKCAKIINNYIGKELCEYVKPDFI